jgi:protein-tyrosine kinase
MVGKRKAKAADVAPPLDVKAADGTPLISFQQEIVTPLRHMASQLMQSDRWPAQISIIAALREEGVTYTTVALAATLASDWHKTVAAVELNWHTPGQAALLNTTASGGVAGVLSGSTELDAALITTALPNLFFLPAGELPIERRAAVARGAELAAVIDQVKQRFDLVLLDIPAVLITSDAIPLASLGAACVLVVRQGVTPQSKAQAALDDVKHLPMLGVVLNRVKLKTPRFIRHWIPQD